MNRMSKNMQRQSRVSQPSSEEGTLTWRGALQDSNLHPLATWWVIIQTYQNDGLPRLRSHAKRHPLPPAPKDQARDSPKTWCQVLVVSGQITSNPVQSILPLSFPSLPHLLAIALWSHWQSKFTYSFQQVKHGHVCAHITCVYTLRYLTPRLTVHQRLHTCTAPYIFVKEFHSIVNPWERWCLAKSRIQLLLGWSLGAIQISFQRLCSF